MFGSKKRQLEEQIRIRETFSKMADKMVSLETPIGQMENIWERISTDLEQASENTDVLTTHANTNVTSESNLIYSMDDFSGKIQAVQKESRQLAEMLEGQYHAALALVEKNKLYTNTSRRLTEIPAELQTDIESCEKQLEEITGCGRQMGVLALNAAIEAGRMGIEGKQFVAASEEIRQMAMDCEKSALALQEELHISQKKMQEYEEVIQYMITLIKESNIAANELFKKEQEMKQLVQAAAAQDVLEDIAVMRDGVVGMRNQDEEIVKCGERNKIQLSDIKEDAQIQKNMLEELRQGMKQVLDMLEEQIIK